ncbi:MAG: hypothetical protein ACJAVU_002977 [Cognaticolwellia sp.]|jgi:hypothetical protein
MIGFLVVVTTRVLNKVVSLLIQQVYLLDCMQLLLINHGS